MLLMAGDIVSLNHTFLKVWFKGNGYFKEDAWTDTFTVTKVEEMNVCHPRHYIVWIENGKSKYFLYVESNGECNLARSYPEYKGIPVFTLHSSTAIKKVLDSGKYCSCDGPAKENWAGGNKFYVCTSCGKEKLLS